MTLAERELILLIANSLASISPSWKAKQLYTAMEKVITETKLEQILCEADNDR